MNNDFTKTYTAEAAIGVYLICKFGAADGGAALATAATDKLLGTSGNIAAASGERVEILREGIDQVTLGGTVVRGDALTVDATSRAIATVTVGNRIIGFAEVSGVVGDVIDYAIAPGIV
jgi:hypothetical protein